MNADPIVIELCMGSACFARGNKNIVAALKSFAAKEGLTDRISIRGALCEGMCKDGPVVKINGTPHLQATPLQLTSLLRNMVKGIQNSGLKSYPDKTQTMDLGIVTMDQQDFDSLLRMVRKGLLNCCPDTDANNMAVR